MAGIDFENKFPTASIIGRGVSTGGDCKGDGKTSETGIG